MPTEKAEAELREWLAGVERRIYAEGLTHGSSALPCPDIGFKWY